MLRTPFRPTGLRCWLRLFAPVLFAAGVLSLVTLAGCGSSDNGSNPTGTVNNVTISLTNAQDVNRVEVFHLLQNTEWESIFSQTYSNQATIDIPLQVLSGEQYRVEADSTDPSNGSPLFSFQDFTASNNNINYIQPGRSRSQSIAEAIVLDVPSMPRLTHATNTSSVR